MKRTNATGLLVVACGCLMAAPARGAVLERDWKTPGDGLLTYDEVNGREWLDLSQSRLLDFPGANREQRIASVVAELGAGGMLEGFQLAKSDDLRGLAYSAGIDPLTSGPSNLASTHQLIALLGPTVTGDNESASSIGILDEFGMGPQQRPVRLFGRFSVSLSSGGTAGLYVATGIEPFEVPGLAVWLYHSTIPEPSSFSILICATTLFFAYVVVQWPVRRSCKQRVPPPAQRLDPPGGCEHPPYGTTVLLNGDGAVTMADLDLALTQYLWGMGVAT